MPFLRNSAPFRGALIATSILGLSLGACREERPQLRAPAALGWPASVNTPYAVMPPPYEGPAPVGQLVSNDDNYAWAERSYAMDDAFYGAQPDYGFRYDDVEPYVWQTADDWAMYGEPYQDDYRFYYYQPGDNYPYFVRDADYGYGYDDGGRLVVIYDTYGQVMPVSFLQARRDRAGDYYRRAYALRNASRAARPVTVTETIWRVEQPRVRRAQTSWIEAAARQDDWVRYRTRTNERDLRAIRDERRRDREPQPTRISHAVFPPRAAEERRPVRAARPDIEQRARIDQRSKVEHRQPKAETPKAQAAKTIREARQRPEARDLRKVKAEHRQQALAKPRADHKAAQARVERAKLQADRAKPRAEVKAKAKAALKAQQVRVERRQPEKVRVNAQAKLKARAAIADKPRPVAKADRQQVPSSDRRAQASQHAKAQAQAKAQVRRQTASAPRQQQAKAQAPARAHVTAQPKKVAAKATASQTRVKAARDHDQGRKG